MASVAVEIAVLVEEVRGEMGHRDHKGRDLVEESLAQVEDTILVEVLHTAFQGSPDQVVGRPDPIGLVEEDKIEDYIVDFEAGLEVLAAPDLVGLVGLALEFLGDH